jgi:hypothetical protein
MNRNNTQQNTQQNTASEYITLYKNFDANQVLITKPEAKKTGAKQLTGYINYIQERKQLILQLPWMKYSHYGLPREDSEYTTDSNRIDLKIPLVEENKGIKTLITKLRELDERIMEASFRKKLFGDNYKKYKDEDYKTIVKEPAEIPEEILAEKPELANKIRPHFLKVKLATSYPDGAITTCVLLDHQDGVEPEMVPVSTVEEFENYYRYGCEFKPVIRAVKFWAQTTTGNKHPMYGITFKLEKIIIRPVSQTSSLLNEVLNDTSFLIDDDDEEQVYTKRVIQDDEASVDSDNEETKELSNDSDDETEQKKTKVKKQVVVDDDSDDDSDEEPEPQPKKKTKAKKPVVVDDDSDDDSDDEPEPQPKKTKAKKPVKKGKKKVVESDSDDSDSDSD